MAAMATTTPVGPRREHPLRANFAQARAKPLQGLPIWWRGRPVWYEWPTATGRRAWQPWTDRRSSRSSRRSRAQYHSAEQLDRLKQATLDILETVGVRFQSPKALDLLERGRGRRGPGDRGRQAAAGPRARGDGDGAAALRPRRPRRELRHRRRRRPHLLHHGRVRRRDRRLRDAGAPPVDEGRPGGRHAPAGRALEHLVLVADAQRRRLRRDGAAARARRRLEQHRQAPAGDGATASAKPATPSRWPP